MGIISYAQNFEDVLLWRALGHIEHGCYIDIGAHDPIVDSVSKAFYEHGWRGIHLEPLPVYCDALRRDRPDETVLQAAVAAETGVLRFFEIPDTGISTGNEAIARSHRERGFQVNEIAVPCVTLAQVFQLVQGDVVHWLKIDVEGLEAQVLQGWGDTRLRPWIVVVESTLPLTQDEVYTAWEGLLLEKGYRCVHFDGLNRYYLAEAQAALETAFRSGPNVFDGFQFNGTANNPFCNHVAQRLRSDLDGQIASLKQQALQHQSDQLRLGELVQSSEKLKQALQAEQTANLQNQNTAKALVLQAEQHARQHSEIQLRTAVQREQEFSAQLLAGKGQLQQLEQAHRAREQHLLAQLAQAEQLARQESETQLRTAMQREQEFSVQLLAGKDQLQQLEQSHRAREQELQAQLAQEQQARHESETQLRTAMQREQEFSAQLLAGKDQLQELEQLHRAREQELQARLAQAEQQARHESETQLRTAMQREQAFSAQLLASRMQLQQIESEYRNRQSELLERLAETERQSHRESEAHLRHAREREQAVAEQLLALQQQAAEKLAQQANELQAQHAALGTAWRTQEEELRREIATLTNERQALRHANELQTQKHSFVMETHQGEHQRLIEAYAAMESRLKAEIEAEQQSNARLRQALAEVQQVLAIIHGSLSWRWTAPLRAMFSLVSPRQSGTQPISACGEFYFPSEVSRHVSSAPSVTISSVSAQPIMPSTSMTQTDTSVSAASTLDELLAYHDQSFVVRAYHTLLGRAPDPEGLNYYLGRLRIGIPKIQLLLQLRSSEEGKACAAELPGLDAAIHRYQRGQYPLIGWLFRLVNVTEGNHPTERKLRGIENQLFVLSNESSRRFDQLETALAGLHHLVVQQTQSAVAVLATASADALESASVSPIQLPVPDGLKHLSPNARDIYFQLKTAAARHGGRAA